MTEPTTKPTQRKRMAKPVGKATAPGVVNVCQVEGCTRRLSREKDYYQRYRVCKFHSTQKEVLLGGELHRFCQQCCAFQHLSSFDGARRSCRERLLLHNNRRKQRFDPRGGGADSDGEDEAAERHDSHAAQQHMEPSYAVPAGDAAHAMTTAGSADVSALTSSRGDPDGERSQSPTDTAAKLQPNRPRRWLHCRTPSGNPADGSANVIPARSPAANGSYPATDRDGRHDFTQEAYRGLRSQSAQFNVSDVAAMWARDDQVHGEVAELDALATLDDDLDAFGALSVTFEDLHLPLPDRGNGVGSGSLDEATTAVTAPSSRRGSYNVSGFAAGDDVSEQSPNSRPNGMHPAAAALNHSWATAAQPFSAQPPLQRPYLQPSPTAALLKRHWHESHGQPKELFARVSWGSGGVGTTPVKARRSVELRSGYAPPLAPSLAGGALPSSSQQQPEGFPELGSPAAMPGGGLGGLPMLPPVFQHLASPAAPRPATSGSNSGGSGSRLAGSGGRSLLCVHAGSGTSSPSASRPLPTPPEQRPLLPDPFAAQTAGMRLHDGASGQQLPSEMVAGHGPLSPQPIALPTADMPASQLDAALERAYGPAMLPQPFPGSRSAGLQAGIPAYLQQQLLAATAGGIADGGAAAAAWQRQGSWAALTATSMPEPVHCSVVISGRSQSMVHDPFSYAAEQHASSLRASSTNSIDSGGFGDGSGCAFGGGGAVNDFIPARAAAEAGQAAPAPQTQPQPFNPYSTVRWRTTGDAARGLLPVPKQQPAPLWGMRADLEKPRPLAPPAAPAVPQSPRGAGAAPPPKPQGDSGSGAGELPPLSLAGHGRRASLCTATAQQLQL